LAKLAIVGAGPQGRVILQAVRAGRAQFEEMAFFDDDVSKEGRVVGGVPVLGGVDRLFQMNDEDYSAAVAIGSNEARTRIAQKIRSAGIAMINVVHPAAIVMPDVVVGSGILVCAGAVVVTGTAMGSDVVINTGATVDHDCSIGAGAYVSPGVHTAGAVSIGAGTFIGAGAIIINVAYRALRRITGDSIGLYRGSRLAAEQFGVGRHPRTGARRVQGFSIAYSIEDVS